MPLPTRPAYSRMLAGRWRTSVCTITDPGAFADGVPIPGTEVVYPDVPCRTVRAGTQPSLEMFGAQMTSEAAWDIQLARGTPVAPGWQVAVNGATYTVMAVAESDGDVFRHALVRGQTAV